MCFSYNKKGWPILFIVIVLLLFDIGALGRLKSRANAKFSFKKLIVKTACEKNTKLSVIKVLCIFIPGTNNLS